VKRASDILAYTVSYGDRSNIQTTVPSVRGVAGVYFDWSIWLGNPTPRLYSIADTLLNDPDRMGVQRITTWPENRGQHHATNEALTLAREMGYKWLLRLDDDVTPKTKKFVSKMVERLEDLKALSGDKDYRLVAAPKIVGLKNPLIPSGAIIKGQRYPVDIMEKLGGGCRLHPVSLLKGFVADIYSPLGRRDPEMIEEHVSKVNGLLVRFPDIRVVHKTRDLEERDSADAAVVRRMGHFWPWLEGAEV
jgi:Glycosyl transferase family 2